MSNKQSRNSNNNVQQSKTLNQQRYVNHFKPTKKPINQDIEDEIMPRKKPFRENHIKYTPSSALMNMKKQKSKHVPQDSSPRQAWIGDSDSDFDDQHWLDHNCLVQN